MPELVSLNRQRGSVGEASRWEPQGSLEKKHVKEDRRENIQKVLSISELLHT